MFTFSQIEAFRATIETGSVSAASRLLHISQPSLSRLIADLESELGFTLFIRQRRGMKPTEEAQLFYRDVERSYLGLRELKTAAEEIRGFGRSRFSFGAAPGVALEFVPKVINRFQKQHGAVQIASHVSTSDRILADTRSGRVSLAIVTPIEPITSDVTVLLEKQFHYVMILHRSHALASAPEPLNVQQIQARELIAPTEAFLSARCDDQAIVNAIQQRVAITIDVSFSAAVMVRQQMGVALIDPFTAGFFAGDDDLVVKPLAGAPRYPFTLIQPKRQIASQLQALFQAEIEAELECV